jgi:hypothetical protein
MAKNYPDLQELVLEYLEEALHRLEAHRSLDDLPFIVGAQRLLNLAREVPEQEQKQRKAG